MQLVASSSIARLARYRISSDAPRWVSHWSASSVAEFIDASELSKQRASSSAMMRSGLPRHVGTPRIAASYLPMVHHCHFGPKCLPGARLGSSNSDRRSSDKLCFELIL